MVFKTFDRIVLFIRKVRCLSKVVEYAPRVRAKKMTFSGCPSNVIFDVLILISLFYSRPLLLTNIKLIGFKLLDGVSKEELLRVASNLREKNNADYIVANDLSRVGNGKHYATIINEEGIYRECETKDEIAKSLRKILFK